jgi:predicted O-linked N-acetylglucosamine transferase (SPINDLY family)
VKSHRAPSGPPAARTAIVDRKIARALEHQRAGRLAEAEGIYRRILDSKPNHSDALHLLGVLGYQVGRSDIAVDLIKKAIAVKGGIAAFHEHLGVALHSQGRLDEAVASFRRALGLDPSLADAHHNLGLALQAKGDLADAAASFLRTIALDPDFAEAYTNLGAVLEAQGRLDEAVASHRQALALKPDLAEAHANLGVALQAQGRLDEAAASHRQALALKPNFPQAHFNLGVALWAKGEPVDAMASFLRAIVLRPDYAAAHTNLGLVLQVQGCLDEAVASFRRALAHKPDLAEAHVNLGVALRAQGRLDEAAASYQRALQLRPDLAEAHNNLGAVLNDLGQFDAAAQCYRHTLALGFEAAEAHANLGYALLHQGRLEDGAASYRRALGIKSDPLYAIAIATASPVIATSTDDILSSRRRVEENIDRLLGSDIEAAGGNRPVAGSMFYVAYQGLNDREIQRKTASLYLKVHPSLDWTAPHCRDRAARPAERIRVGFVSRYLYEHSIGKLARGLIERLSRERFEVIVLHAGGKVDEFSVGLDQAATRAVRLPTDLDEARNCIAGESLDVLFYPDVGMDAATYLLAFARMAPVQCVSWGHPVTTGIPNVDYFVSSVDLEPEDADDHYTERLHRLSRLPVYYYRPAADDGPPDRGRLGLEEGCTLYVCPQSLFKLHPDFDAVLGDILHRDRTGRIVLIEGFSADWSRCLRERLGRVLGGAGDRVCFLPRLGSRDFTDLLRTADALLDPLHFGGGNSTYEALALGAPIVTWPGRFMRGRVTYACYRQIGVTECVAGSAEEYAEIAVRLANDREWHAQVSRKILAGNHGLFEDMAAVKELETFFTRAVTAARVGREACDAGGA